MVNTFGVLPCFSRGPRSLFCGALCANTCFIVGKITGEYCFALSVLSPFSLREVKGFRPTNCLVTGSVFPQVISSVLPGLLKFYFFLEVFLKNNLYGGLYRTSPPPIELLKCNRVIQDGYRLRQPAWATFFWLTFRSDKILVKEQGIMKTSFSHERTNHLYK